MLRIDGQLRDPAVVEQLTRYALARLWSSIAASVPASTKPT
jgi:hypothetical protein